MIDNWRAAHNYPLNAFHMTLKNRVRRITRHGITAQRIKRLESIFAKLVKQKTMNLSQMQDIGGCRAIVPTLVDLNSLRSEYEIKKVVHEQVGFIDYIANPKPDGYRSVHFVYKYSGQQLSYAGLRVEIQLRTLRQHIWATAVEAAGTFTKQALKSNQGREEWLRFFACMSTLFAIRERCDPVPGTPTNIEDLKEEITHLEHTLHVITILQSYTVTAQQTGLHAGMKYFLVHLDPLAKTVDYKGFRANQSEEANAAYTALEAEISSKEDAQAVLVSVDSINALRRAYPNYFLDTGRFVSEVQRLINTKRRVR